MTQKEKKPDVNALLTGMEVYIRETIELLDAGRYQELTALEEKVAKISGQLTTLPPDTTRAYADRLDAVRRQLDLLKQLMEEHQGKIRLQLQALNANKQANKAYARSESMATPKPTQE